MSSTQFEGLLTTLLGYIIIAISLAGLHGLMSLLHVKKYAISVYIRVAPESGSGQNPAFFPNLAKIRLRSKFRRSRMLLPDVKNAHK